MKAILIAIFVLFDAYTLYAMYQVGYVGIWAAGFANAGSLQVLLDLTAGVTEATTQQALESLRESGVELTGKPVVQ